MVHQKIQKNVKYYFYIQQNWRGMVLRKYTLAVHWLLEDLLHACDDKLSLRLHACVVVFIHGKENWL